MAYRLTDVLRYMFGGDKKERAVFQTEREAYDFCRAAYAKNGGVPDELRRAYEFYVTNYNDGSQAKRGPFEASDR
jgi:hypothetical protein